MSKVLRVTVPRCIACGKCELACAFAHADQSAPEQPRIHVARRGPDAGSPLVCFQCEDAACVAVCSTGALARNPATGAIEIDAARCIRCRVCVAACPFGSMAWDDRSRRPEKCDLCGGEPRCVPFCATGALEYVSADRVRLCTG